MIWINGSNITFEHNVIHDALLVNSAAHTECMYVWAVTNLTLKRNNFFNCAVMDVFITGGATANGGFIENNYFANPTGPNGNSFHFRTGGDPTPDPSNWDFRYNTFGPGGHLSISSESPVGPGGMRVIGNDFQGDVFCSKAGTVFSYNRGCNGITTTRDQGNPFDFPAFDIDGVARPMGAGPDIGSKEG